MSGSIEIREPLVSVDWLRQHFEASNLIILDASIQKATDDIKSVDHKSRSQIKNALFFDLKKKFSDVSSEFPNTMPTPEIFSEFARNLGINKDSALVVYDDLGIYSSPRVRWMFKAMGHHNIAVLDGGLPEWQKAGYPCEAVKKYAGEHGDFTANYHLGFISEYADILNAINNKQTIVVDARSENRFKGLEAEPREGLRSGHIPKSINLPYTQLIEDNKMVSKIKLSESFSKFDSKEDSLIFSCGSGITACILALAAEMIGLKNISIYDGSWTEWGSKTDLPIEK